MREMWVIPVGTPRAMRAGMSKPITRAEDLVAWQFASELADLVDEITEKLGGEDPDWIRQIRKSSAKVPAQIEEGFLRFLPRDSANYYRYARASLGETRSHLRRGRRRRHLTEDRFQRAMTLVESAMSTTMGLLKSRLEASKGQRRNRRTPPAAKAPKTPRRREYLKHVPD
jgi:four helix bundle protein